MLTCWLVRRLWEAERHHQSLTAKLNEDSHNHHHHQEVVEQQQQHQTGAASAATHPKPATPLLRTHHHENINQVIFCSLFFFSLTLRYRIEYRCCISNGTVLSVCVERRIQTYNTIHITLWSAKLLPFFRDKNGVEYNAIIPASR